MLIACQLRLSTSTIILFNMSFIKCLHMVVADGHQRVRCLFFVVWLEIINRKSRIGNGRAASPGCASQALRFRYPKQNRSLSRPAITPSEKIGKSLAIKSLLFTNMLVKRHLTCVI